jgi:predicted RNase H-like nuclease
MDEPLSVGADWSGAGWFAVAFAGETCDHAAVLPRIGDVWARYRDAAGTVLLDVPVGLLEGGGGSNGEVDEADAAEVDARDGREVDRLARSVLGDRAPSVFAPPVREAAHKQRYAAASRTNERLAGGYAERLRILEGVDPDAPAVVQQAAAAAGDADVRGDDVLDATVLAYAAGPAPGDRRTLPPDPPTDPTGLPMRMVYRSEKPLVE